MTNLPDWMPESLWEEFRKHRQRIRAPMTDYAGTLILSKLDKFRSEGANPIDVLNESIERGWAGVFLNGHAKQIGKIKCKECGSGNWISMSGGKCQECRK